MQVISRYDKGKKKRINAMNGCYETLLKPSGIYGKTTLLCSALFYPSLAYFILSYSNLFYH